MRGKGCPLLKLTFMWKMLYRNSRCLSTVSLFIFVACAKGTGGGEELRPETSFFLNFLLLNKL